MLLVCVVAHSQGQNFGWKHEGLFYILTTADGAILPASASVEGNHISRPMCYYRF